MYKVRKCHTYPYLTYSFCSLTHRRHFFLEHGVAKDISDVIIPSSAKNNLTVVLGYGVFTTCHRHTATTEFLAFEPFGFVFGLFIEVI